MNIDRRKFLKKSALAALAVPFLSVKNVEAAFANTDPEEFVKRYISNEFKKHEMVVGKLIELDIAVDCSPETSSEYIPGLHRMGLLFEKKGNDVKYFNCRFNLDEMASDVKEMDEFILRAVEVLKLTWRPDIYPWKVWGKSDTDIFRKGADAAAKHMAEAIDQEILNSFS